MKTNLIARLSTSVLVTSVLMVLSQAAVAQVSSETLSADVDAQIDQMSGAVGGSKQTQAVVNQTVVVPQQTVQKQPTTVVEASPLTDSKADGMRRSRQDEEMRTESRIVEKLEQSRLEDEKRRAAVLFGDKFDNLQNQAPSNVQVIQAPAAPVVTAPVAAPVVTEPALTRDAVREEVRAALDEEDSELPQVIEQKYFSVLAGIGQVTELDNAIKGNYSLGFSFGNQYDLFMVEGSFIYSNYSILGASYPVFQNGYYIGHGLADFDMDQYQGLLAAKYQLLSGMMRPYVGGLVSYSYRKYISKTPVQISGNPPTVSGEGTELGSSHAFDVGVTAGVDVSFGHKLSLGADFKYLFNVATRLDGGVTDWGKSPEKIKYYMIGLNAKVNF